VAFPAKSAAPWVAVLPEADIEKGIKLKRLTDMMREKGEYMSLMPFP